MSISYGGGPLLTHAVTLYPLFYGVWNASRVGLVHTLLSGISATTLWSVVTEYADASGARATSDVTVAPPTYLGAPYGTNWGGTDHTAALVASFMHGRHGNASTVPVVMVAANVNVPGWGTDMCGYHSAVGGAPYIFAGDTQSEGCTYFRDVLFPGAAVLIHEVAETVTDPFGTGWRTADAEMGDLCDWELIPTADAPNGYYSSFGVRWNLMVGGAPYMVQPLWDPTGGVCSLGPATPAPPAPPGAPGEPPLPPGPRATKPRSVVGACFAAIFVITMAGTNLALAVLERETLAGHTHVTNPMVAARLFVDHRLRTAALVGGS